MCVTKCWSCACISIVDKLLILEAVTEGCALWLPADPDAIMSCSMIGVGEVSASCCLLIGGVCIRAKVPGFDDSFLPQHCVHGCDAR